MNPQHNLKFNIFTAPNCKIHKQVEMYYGDSTERKTNPNFLEHINFLEINEQWRYKKWDYVSIFSKIETMHLNFNHIRRKYKCAIFCMNKKVIKILRIICRLFRAQVCVFCRINCELNFFLHCGLARAPDLVVCGQIKKFAIFIIFLIHSDSLFCF